MTSTKVERAGKFPENLIAACDELFGGGASGLFAVMAEAFDQMELAEDEIRKAQDRHPAHRDRLYHSFSLLKPNMGLERMASEMVYRAHCRELLERVVAGTDTRPGTAAEVCCVMLETTKLAPLTSAAAGLYMRMWSACGFPELDQFSEASAHHEALERVVIDDHERLARRKLADNDRTLGEIECKGLHHGTMVECAYLPTGQLTIDV